MTGYDIDGISLRILGDVRIWTPPKTSLEMYRVGKVDSLFYDVDAGDAFSYFCFCTVIQQARARTLGHNQSRAAVLLRPDPWPAVPTVF